MSWKKRLYRESKKFPLAETLRTSLKATFTHKGFFCTNLSLFPPKAILFYPPSPISTPLTYCLQRIQPFFWCSLNFLRWKAGASHRFKSLPAIPDEVAVFRKTGYLMKAGHFRKNHVSTGDLNRPRSPEVRKPLVYFWFFSYKRKE